MNTFIDCPYIIYHKTNNIFTTSTTKMEEINNVKKDKLENPSMETTEKIEAKKGGIITMPFIFANEVCEKLAVVGIGANMVNFFRQQFHMSIIKAANTHTNFSGTSSLMPLLGAFLADSFAGRFWTITAGSTIYLMGMICLTLSASLPQLRPPPCEGNEVCQEANNGQLLILYLSLLLLALGSGGIRPCVAAFGADQFAQENATKMSKTWVYFNWYYFVMGASILLASTVIVYIQDNVGWSLGLGIPTIAMLLSIFVFVIGYPLYRILDPPGSPYTRVVQVIISAFRKRKVAMVFDTKLLYENEELDALISRGGTLHHTQHLKSLDKAAIVTEQDHLKRQEKPNLWRLNTVHRVEELKSVIRMLPIWAAGILLSTASAQMHTFSLQQANTMNKHLTPSFEIPSASMSVFTTTSMLTTIVVYDRVFVPFLRRFTKLDRGINYLQRMAIGFFISILATFVAGFIEIRRKEVAFANGLIDNAKTTIPISVFWLIPQYSLHGIAEAFMAVGHLEFLYDQAPESMRSTATALFWTANSAGNYASSILVTLVHKYSGGPNGSNWLPDDNLNKGKLEYFDWLLTFLQIINFVYYLVCTKFYTFKPIQGLEEEDEKKLEVVEV